MKYRILPIFKDKEKLFVIQEERYFFKFRYWGDVKDIYGYSVIVPIDQLQEAITHLSKVQELTF